MIPSMSAESKAPEFEITPEMLKAGAEILLRDYCYDFTPCQAEDRVEEILKRALSARPEKTVADRPGEH